MPTDKGGVLAGQRLADRRGRRPDQERHPRRACKAAATRRSPSSTRPNGRRRRRSSGSAGRSRASARRSSASSRPTTARAAAPIAAFKAAGVNPVPPVTGNDATIAALQLIIAGDQYNTISKPSEIVAAAAAKVAVGFLSGQAPKAETTLYNTPSQLFTPAVVTAKNLKAEIIDKRNREREGAVHRPLCRRLQEAGHRELIRRDARRDRLASPDPSIHRRGSRSMTDNSTTRSRAAANWC